MAETPWCRERPEDLRACNGVIVTKRIRIGRLGPAVLATLWLGGALALVLPVPADADTFDSHWQDGKAELSGYRYSVTRYGQRREGTAVLIYVTEPMSESRRVKVDDPKKNPKDTFEAMKVNVVREFRTGIYDYHTLASIFTRTRDFSPAKITFSSAEWCGHVFEEMIFHRHHLADRYLSYFEGESDLKRLTMRENSLTEEELLVRLRGLRGEWIRPGEKKRVPFLPAAFYRRLTHRPLVWSDAVIERARASGSVRVPAGRFEASLVTVRTEQRVGRFWIENGYPHRILRWEWTAVGSSEKGRSPAEGLDRGELTGSARLKYWSLNGPGGERYRRELGLAPASAPSQRRN
jgi:hypothetical protein